MEMYEMNSAPTENVSPPSSSSITPETGYFPESSLQSHQIVNSVYSTTSINQLHDTSCKKDAQSVN